MLKTDEQRRWWFANHPEYSSSRKRKKGDKDEVEEPASRQKVRPEDVDAYVDNALKYVDEDAAHLLKSFKEQFGTEAAAKTTDQSAAYRATAQQQPINDTMDGPVQRAAEEPEEPAPEGNAAKKPQAGQANTGSGWDNPAQDGSQPEFPEFSTWEKVQLYRARFLDWLQQKRFDLDQARRTFHGDFKKVLPGQSDPSKKHRYGDAPEVADQFRRNNPLFGGKDDEFAKNTKKVFKRGGKALETAQQLKDTLKKVAGKEKNPSHPSKKGIPKVGNRYPINHRLAGKKHPVTGTPFTRQGFPDFRAVAIKSFRLRKITGNRKIDESRANKRAHLSETPDGYTWHHVEDTRTMHLIPTNIHEKVGHTGGVAVDKHGGLKYE